MALSRGHGLLVVCPLLLAAVCATRPQDYQDPKGSKHGSTPPPPADAGPACLAPGSWFQGPTTPFPGPDEFAFQSLCDFHQWTWQTFLALMSPQDPAKTGGALVFEGFAEPADLFRPGGPKSAYPGSGNTVWLIHQAGPGDHVLFDQAGQLVYYSTYLNQVYWDFVVANKLYELDQLRSVSPEMVYPQNTLELKVSWRVAADEHGTYIEDPSSYYTLDAVVPGYRVTDHNTVVTTDEARKVTLAMVGFHVVGTVKNHPEFIWGTFEHLDNVPDGAVHGSDPATKGPFGAEQAAWGFYRPGTPTDQTNMYTSTKPLEPSNITRRDPWGGGSVTNTDNLITLNESVWGQLPASRSVLQNYFESGAIWTNGMGKAEGSASAAMLPAIPVNNAGSPPNVQVELKGSFHEGDHMAGIANTTMETFTQTQNCFYCHNAGMHTVQVLQPDGSQEATIVGAKNLNLSHFLVNYQAEQQLLEGK